MPPKRNPEGIEVRHEKGCRTSSGGRCSCRPSYRAHVWSNAERRRIRKTFSTPGAAKALRRDALVALDAGIIKADKGITISEAAAIYIAGMKDGSIRSRKGEPYKPSARRGYERCLRRRIVPALGALRLGGVTAATSRSSWTRWWPRGSTRPRSGTP